MPQVNLSGLNGSELRQLLDASRRRGDAALSYSILQEMAARRDGGAARHASKGRRQSEPRVVAVDLSGPTEKDQLPPMPNWRPAPQDAKDELLARDEPIAAAEPQTPEPVEISRPLSLRRDEPTPPYVASEDLDLRLRPASPRKERAAPRGVSLRVFAGFTAGIALGTAFGWWAGGMARDVLPLPAPIQTAALAPEPAPPPPPPAAAPLAEALPVPAADTLADAVTPPQVNEPVPAEAASEATEPPAPSTPVVASGCATEPTPADRVICGHPNLQRLQSQLRHAYAEALDAHEDRDLLRQRQLAWRDARNAVSDPDRLTALYEARIRKLNAATGQAQGAR